MLKIDGMIICISSFPLTTNQQLHFGFSNPAITDLIEIWPKTIDQQDYAKQIFTQIEKARNTAREKAKAWNKTNITYRNQKRQDKKFSPGQGKGMSSQ